MEEWEKEKDTWRKLWKVERREKIKVIIEDLIAAITGEEEESQDQNQEDKKGEKRDKKYTEEKEERKNDEEGDIQQEKQGKKCSEDLGKGIRIPEEDLRTWGPAALFLRLLVIGDFARITENKIVRKIKLIKWSFILTISM